MCQRHTLLIPQADLNDKVATLTATSSSMEACLADSKALEVKLNTQLQEALQRCKAQEADLSDAMVRIRHCIQ